MTIAVERKLAMRKKEEGRRKKEEGRRKARHGFGHGYTDELFSRHLVKRLWKPCPIQTKT
ncbi:MAG: hypothetical protein ACRC62_25050 [Microcoleus sp.]